MKKSSIVIAALLCLFPSVCLADENGAYTGYAPYSIFAIGDLSNPGSAYNTTMGGVGIASRNKRYLNSLNPAAVTCRDSLSVMSDFSFKQNNKLFREGDMYSTNNTFNMSNLALSFPLFHRTAAMVGFTPYSNTGYGGTIYVTDPALLAAHGLVTDTFSGKGSLYQAYGAFGYNPFGGLSLGVQYNIYFGSITKSFSRTFEDADTRDISSSSTTSLKSSEFKFGLQYEHNFSKKLAMSAGATYSLGGSLSSVADDVSDYAPSGAFIAPELGLGLAFNYADKLRMELNYTRSDWTNSSLYKLDNNSVFETGVSSAFRFGMEYIPNANDIRYYYKHFAYRAGAYHKTEYYTVNGSPVVADGITLGFTMPVFRWYNGLTLGLDLGRRAAKDNISEMFIGFTLGVNMFDIWFQKPMYD